MQPGRGDRLRRPVAQVGGWRDQQPPGTLGIVGPHDPAVAGPGRDTGHDVEPVLVGVFPDDRYGRPGRVGGQQPHPALVAALHHDQRISLVPAHRDQVRELGPVPLDRRLTAVEPGVDQRYVRVRRSGRRVGHLRRPARGVRRIGDVPPGDRCFVHPGHQEGGPVWRPPVPARPAHLLRGHKLRQAEGQPRRAGGPDEFRILIGAQRYDAERAVADIGDTASSRVRAGIERGRPGGQRAGQRGGRVGRAGMARDGRRRGEVHHVYLPGQHEGGHGQGGVGGEGHDAGGLLADPFPAGLFLPGQADRGVTEHGRVGSQVLAAGPGVQDPQAVHRVVAAPAAQEPYAAAVG